MVLLIAIIIGQVLGGIDLDPDLDLNLHVVSVDPSHAFRGCPKVLWLVATYAIQKAALVGATAVERFENATLNHTFDLNTSAAVEQSIGAGTAGKEMDLV
jgi:hypothetical protein